MITDAGLIAVVRELVHGAIYFAWVIGIGRGLQAVIPVIPYFFPQKPVVIDLSNGKKILHNMPESDADRGPIC
ncbi:MAG: hypothetical protein ACYDAL_16365 [Candidatus Dormibacteraceae bacterium]